MKIFLLIVLMFSLVSCDSSLPLDVGNGYKIEGFEGDIYIFSSNNVITVERAVLRANFDAEFVIAEQNPIDSIVESQERRYNYTESERRINENRHYHYWIIDKRNNHKFGPLHRKEFDKKKLDLNVSDTLQLVDVYLLKERKAIVSK